MAITPYLFFRGRCEEAIAFYQKALSAEVAMQMRFKDNPEKPDPSHVPADFDERIMHASLHIKGHLLMMSDGMESGTPLMDSISLSLDADDEADADRLFAALSDGGTVQMPMRQTFFAKRFGAVKDKFGVSWMISLMEPQPR